VLLRKGRGEERVAKVQDSPGMFPFTLSLGLNLGAAPHFAPTLTFLLYIDCPEEEATYVITKGGIDDPGNGKDK
jgi:hypothetical protein